MIKICGRLDYQQLDINLDTCRKRFRCWAVGLVWYNGRTLFVVPRVFFSFTIFVVYSFTDFGSLFPSSRPSSRLVPLLSVSQMFNIKPLNYIHPW